MGRENKSRIMFPEPKNDSIPDFIVIPLDLSAAKNSVFVGILFYGLVNIGSDVPVR